MINIIDDGRLYSPGPWHKILYFMEREVRTLPVILGHAKSRKMIIHGGRALNVQIPWNLRRTAKDWDIIAENAYREADVIEDKLDEVFGCNMFYVKPIVIKKGNGKIVFRVISRADGESIVDVVEGNGFPPHVVIDDVKYETLKELRRKASKILENPELRFRWWKAKRDILIIDRAIEQMNWERRMNKLVHGLLR